MAVDLRPREVEVLQLAARGLSNKEIAKELIIAGNTVKVHFANIYARLGTHNRVHAVVLGIKLGIISAS